MKRAFWYPMVVVTGVLLGVRFFGVAAPIPMRSEPDLPKLARESYEDRRRLAERLITTIENTALPEEKRWAAAGALGELDDRVALDYLVNHIDLRLQPPILAQTEDRGERQVCFYALTTRPPGRVDDDDSWNPARAVLRALGQRRTEGELARYARVLELTLGHARFSDKTTTKPSRALVLVEAELSAEQIPTRVPGCSDDDRRDRIKNLTELRRMLGGK